MEPFVHLPEYPFVICKECKFACIVSEVDGHLRERHRGIDNQRRQQIANDVASIPGTIQNQAALADFPYPAPTTTPIPFIEPPKNDGFQCRECKYIVRQRRNIKRHCQEVHGWCNPRKRGRHPGKGANVDGPWLEGVQCQRFFRSRAASGWFEVGRGTTTEQDGPAETVERRLLRIHQEQDARFAARKAAVEAGDEKRQPNPWLRRVGWAEHLQGLQPDALRELTRPSGDNEPVLYRICESFERVVAKAQAAAVPGQAGLAALFEVNRKEAHIKASKPFDSRMEDDTWARYREVMRKLVCFVFRSQDLGDEARPPYELTERQGDLVDSLQDAAEELAAGSTDEAREASIDRMCLDMLVALFDHQLKHDHYESVVISGLAVLGVREDGGWMIAEDYTPVYSAVIKIARMLVIYQAVLEQQDEVDQIMQEKGTSHHDARQVATSLFQLVRVKVQRFMTVIGKKSDPSPIDWVFDSRSYGFRIRFTTAAGSGIDWHGDRVTYQRIKVDMNSLADMLHEITGEARELLGELVTGNQGLPAIDWARIEDDNSEEQVGYSFIQDDRNTWLETGRNWVIRQILDHDERRSEWVSDSTAKVPYRVTAVRKYGQQVEEFRERLLMLMHMIGGQPLRGPNIIEIRHSNTAYGGLRNVFIERGMVSIVTSNHKNYRSSEQVKIIHRYLPREVGELVVWYLWLVLPFWEQVQGIVKEADVRSSFLFADEIVSRGCKEESREGSIEDSATPSAESIGVGEDGFADWMIERRWTSDRLRRIMQQHSGRHIGQRIGISVWRHVAIAISNRYLKKGFGPDGTEEAEDDEDDEGTSDSIWDLQAGHSTHVAGMVYARELQQGLFGTAARRDQFRAISRQWHRFFGFGRGDEGGPGAGTKRKLDVFDGVRDEARFRRFARLRQMDIVGQLKQMMGKDTEFRGIQVQVIRAIVRGDGPIVQVTGTGGGKSLSFMLPAYCSPDGVTIVVVPLVALREDLHRRCETIGIKSHIWQSRGENRAASIVFVTPESAVTKGFGLFVNRLQGRQQLDRIVVDECHTVLDSDRAFRPRMRELGDAIRQFGVQAVFLTATLAPRDEDEFFGAMSLSRPRVCFFRTRTTRTNVGYHIIEAQSKEEVEEVTGQVVALGLQSYESGKIIVYSGEIEQAERLGRSLECPVYHSKVGTTEEKARRMKEWSETGRTIVATNALGLGIDIPDVRLVVHAGMPRRLRDYAQESGRAGRDGSASKAVIIKLEKTENGSQSVYEGAMQEFVSGHECRRVVLDRVMDGWVERLGCEEGEEHCDVCRVRQGRDGETGADNTCLSEESSEYMAMRRRNEWDEHQGLVGSRTEGAEVEQFRTMVESWVGCCAVCRLKGEEGWYHDMGECRNQGSIEQEEIEDGIRVTQREMFGKRRFERFSGCFYCGIPQGLCDRWMAADDDGGRFSEVRGKQCQYEGVLVKMYVVWLRRFEEAGLRVVGRMMKVDGLLDEGAVARYKWMGKRIKWGGLEGNRFCQLCLHLGLLERV